MSNKILPRLISGSLILLGVAALLLFGPEVSRAIRQSATSNESWELGFVVEGEPTSNDLIGRILDKAAFRSQRDSDIYFVFPPAANRPAIEAARFKIAKASGTYQGEVGLTLEILENSTGALRQVISTANNGWQTAGNDWTPLTLSGSDLQIAPDELLAFHFHLSGPVGGDLDIRPEFEVEVRPTEVRVSTEAGTTTILRSGFTVEGTPIIEVLEDDEEVVVGRANITNAGTPTYDAVNGRLAGAVAAFRSNRDVSDIYYIFPASTIPATIQAIKFYRLSQTGAYDAGNVHLTFRTYSKSGGAQHILNNNIDLKTAPAGAWVPVADLTNTTIQPDEFLAARVEFTGGSAGTLDLRLLFEVEVSSSEAEPPPTLNIQYYFPLILK